MGQLKAIKGFIRSRHIKDEEEPKIQSIQNKKNQKDTVKNWWTMWIERLNETISKEIPLYKSNWRRNRRGLRKRWNRLDCLNHEVKKKKSINLATNININYLTSEHYTSIITPVCPHSWNPFSALLHFHLFLNTNVWRMERGKIIEGRIVLLSLLLELIIIAWSSSVCEYNLSKR